MEILSIKNLMLCIFIFQISSIVVADGIYLWEYSKNGERSCCLSISGTDICNPQTPCTRNVYTDLMSINDYIARLLGLEKASSLSYFTILTQAQYYIKHVLTSSITQLFYRYDEQRNIKFFHEMSDLGPAKSTDKIGKSTAVTTSATATSSASKQDDKVFQYLVRLGLARPSK